ncbi:hypothetical protein KFL_009240070 [Klebsormidium nitens]|uniref:Patatin n=1 Tax=Klebsormidium nitens TaxID=105231 RepID=A0A1Y1ITH4_KLENI|nr:hypothetical protein KFL_009240070 [Klebsormidium nitens]|eukprot:GAQ92116.1 hypothetical protein KFL_009240070 [Klebsormidium nitens]
MRHPDIRWITKKGAPGHGVDFFWEGSKYRTAEVMDCVVFGGGGLSFPAHLGALRALEEAGVTPKTYAGASCGANVAALRVAGYMPEELHEAQKKVGGMAEVEGLLRARTGKDRPTFEDVSGATGSDLSVSTYCLTTGRTRRFSTSTDPGLGLVDVLRASCSVPLWNPPVEIDGSAYLDGGVLERLPMLDRGDPSRTLGLELTSGDGGGTDVGAIFDRIAQHLNEANEREFSERDYGDSVLRLLDGASLPERGAERADEMFRVGFERTKEYLLRKAEAAMRGDETADQHAP